MSPLSHLHKGAYVVVANAEPDLLRMMVDTLRSADHCVFQAYDGMSALELTLALQRVDLLITNTRMPGFHGPELIHEVRQRRPTVPVLYVKNVRSLDDMPIELPPDVPILAEPFTPEQFLSAVRPLLVLD